jgi:hypothetical protein
LDNQFVRCIIMVRNPEALPDQVLAGSVQGCFADFDAKSMTQ